MHEFCQFVAENLGAALGVEAASLVSELGRRIAAVTGDPRSASFLRQKIGIGLQRGNFALITSTLEHLKILDKFGVYHSS